ncbi:MAG TPA: glycosyltransferase [Longimicrobiales bacterium]|nr:glycosyltransferase [Longimicrobiales bacterium]
MTTPLLPDVGLLAMPYHRFGSRWMTPHHVLTRLASYFHVLWLEPTHHWRDTRSWNARRMELTKLAPLLPPGFHIGIPEPWLPDLVRPAWLRRAVADARVRGAWRRLRGLGCTTRVLYLWHPRFEPALAIGKPHLSLYHIDDEYSFSPEPGPMDPVEFRVIQGVDHVFAISPALMERKSGINPSMTFSPEGVDFPMYATPVPEPRDIASIPHPRIGYTGTLKEQLDWPLLHELAAQHPEWSFIFVGPENLRGELRTVLDEMSRMPNVHMLGPKTVWNLPAYPQHFDVCIMPYTVNGYTNNIYPLKLHEYLASGRPVVGAAIRSLLDFRPVITLATGVQGWSAALAAALAPAAAAPEAIAARREIARAHDWSEIIDRIARTICEGLGPEFAERMERARQRTAPPAAPAPPGPDPNGDPARARSSRPASSYLRAALRRSRRAGGRRFPHPRRGGP